MNEKVKLVVLGGSGVATPGLIEALTGIPGRRTPVELVLVGRSEEKLALVSGVSLLVAGDDPLISIHHTTQVEEALNGCSYVLNQVRVGGLAARVYDESFPNELGIPGEETVGAGGFANASRTIPVVLEYARMIERICPQATLLSFSNPSSLVQNAVTRYTTVKTIGLCDAPITLGQNIARALDVPFGQLSIDYLGMHHFGWVNGVWHKDRDLLPQALEKAALINPAIEASLIQSSGVIPGSYLKYIYHADRMLSQKTGKTTRAEELLVMQDELLEDYRVAIQTGQKPTTFNRRNAVWYKWVIAPLLVDLLEGSRRDENNLPPWRPSRHILNITNQNTISWMPENAIVEVPVLVENGHLRPLATRPLPVEERVLLQMNYAYERLAVEAIVLHNQDKAIRALCLNPLVHSYDQAKAVLNKAWDKEFK